MGHVRKATINQFPAVIAARCNITGREGEEREESKQSVAPWR